VSPPPAGDRNWIGKTIRGKYLVRSIVGEGGMGTIFDAVQLALDRSVALKVLRPGHAQRAASVVRFQREARAAGRITHPNICHVYDLDTLDDGRPFLVMEKLIGETLADRIAARGALRHDHVVEILVQTLSALVAAHEQGIVHRDIKPDNVFLTSPNGYPFVVKLLDFGVSRWVGPAPDERDGVELTGRGMVMGTPYYMSPEQVRGDRNVDARVDVYACGVVLYEALTGQRPFEAPDQAAVLRAILTRNPRPAGELRPTLPRGFDTVLRTAMAPRRDDRYPGAAEFRGALHALRGQLPRPSATARGGIPAPVGPRVEPHVDGHPTQPTRVWLRSPPVPPADDAAPTRVMARPIHPLLDARPRLRGW
jgi:serine/threonine-protein kinase